MIPRRKQRWLSPGLILFKVLKFCVNVLPKKLIRGFVRSLEFLLDQVRRESLQAEEAIAAVLRARPSPEVTKRLEELVAGNGQLSRTFTKHRATAW
jgi:hypothetical protein